MSAARRVANALRVGGTGMRALSLARSALPTAELPRPGLRAHTRARRRRSGEGTASCGWFKHQVAAACAAASIASAMWSDAARCEALEEEEEEDGLRDAKPVENCAVQDSDSDAANEVTSTYFDSDYEVTSLLGSGAFGVVMRCVHKQTGRVAAVKMVQDLAGNQEEVARERRALEQLEHAGGHDNVVRFQGSYYHNDFHYLVLEYVPGVSLHAFMEKHRALEPTWALQLVAQLASALAFMHAADVIHRDLKPENIMAVASSDKCNRARGDSGDDEEVTLKLIDFGSAGRLSVPEATEKTRPATLSGTRCYWSPEVLLHQDTTAAMDMWALGCILYILISGRHPFDLMGCSTEQQVLTRVTDEPVSFLLPEWQHVPSEVKELIRGLLEKDPNRRLSAEEVLAHPAVVDSISKAS